MKTRKSKVQSLVIDIAIILSLVMAAIVFAFHGLNTKIPSLFQRRTAMTHHVRAKKTQDSVEPCHLEFEIMDEAIESDERPQSPGEEIANSVSHGVGLVAAVVAVPILIVANV